ncbi:MAG: hypothetical protein CW346_13420, partial [Bacillaceae bacterium]|nr:hypothetical protein [Bacillaceae bacterium]
MAHLSCPPLPPANLCRKRTFRVPDQVLLPFSLYIKQKKRKCKKFYNNIFCLICDKGVERQKPHMFSINLFLIYIT